MTTERTQIAVRAGQISKTFGERRVIDSFDLTIYEGEFVALIGASGCGKTTLLRLCAGLEKPTGGKLQVLGLTPEEACRTHQIGVAFQRPALIPSRTALENVQLTLTVTRSTKALDPEQLLTRFGLVHALKQYPHQLSGGMQQRVNIACALVHQPRLLLLDEPFGALDELTRERLIDWVGGILRGGSRTTILVTHSVEEAVTLADRIVVMGRCGMTAPNEVRVDLPNLRDFGVRQSDDFLRLVRKTREALHAAMGE
jgi:NitT/TauT family transport system ATP-binding protein